MYGRPVNRCCNGRKNQDKQGHQSEQGRRVGKRISHLFHAIQKIIEEFSPEGFEIF
jgi:hypothetical protein